MSESNKLTLDDLELSVRSENVLRELGIGDIESLITLTPGALLSVRGCGKYVIQDIREKLAFHGLALTGDILVMSAGGLLLVKQLPDLIKDLRDKLNYIHGDLRHISEILDQIRIREEGKR